MKTFKKYKNSLLILILSINVTILSSCSTNTDIYVSTESIKFDDNKFYLEGEKFTGFVVNTRKRTGLRIKSMGKVSNGVLTEFKEYIWDDDGLNYTEIELLNGLKAYVSDGVTLIENRTFRKEFNKDGSVYSLEEFHYNEDDVKVMEKKTVYQKDGTIKSTKIYKDGELVSSEN